ncbi:MAG TPA: helix-turn-helix domain-containing protein [Ktedonobacterales bacterium]|nr:helix-turn-helix domain-containing protein [Ktedonobacterales bacterium]
MDAPRNGSTCEFARRLAERLKELNWNRRVLAEKMDVSVATVGNWLRGLCFPEIGSRDRLCKLLGMSAKELHLPPFNDKDGA